MGTITTFTKKDGSISYTARVRISRAGKQIHNEVETFSRKGLAQAWIKRRETELAAPGVLDTINLPDPPLGDIIRRYLDETLAKSGRTKRLTLTAIAKSELGKVPASSITSQRLTEYAKDRIAGGAKPATVSNDLTLLGTVFDLAAPAWGYRLKRETLNDAKIVCHKLGYISRPSERTRRPTMEELDALMHHFHDAARRRPWSAPMVKMLPFAIFSTRRLEEMLRIRWDGLDHDNKRAWITDVKHPRKKIGNHKWAKVPDEAWEILLSMPRVDDLVFPYHGDAVGAQFTRACQWLGIEDLHLHDMRHEGVSRLFEMDWPIPRVAEVSLHSDWNMMRRYTHMNGKGDRFAGWKWLDVAIAWQPKKNPSAP